MKVLLGGLALLGLGVHGWFIAGAGALDTDRAIVLLMAEAFAEGRPTPYFWAQNYMGALEPLLLTPLAWLGWATPVSAGLVALTLTGALAVAAVALGRRVGAPTWIVVLLWAVPPAVVVHHHVVLYGGRLAATTLMMGAVLLLARSVGDGPDRGGQAVLAGVLTGIAYFGDHLMLPWAAGAAWLAARGGRFRGWALGAVPLVALDTVLASLTPAFHLSGPNDPVDWILNIPRLVAVTAPRLFGLLPSTGPVPVYRDATVPLPDDALGWVAAIAGAGVLVAVGGTLLRRTGPLRGRAEAFEGQVIHEAFGVAVAWAALLYGLTGGGGDPWSERYLVPLWPALTVWIAWALGRWSPGLRALGLAGLLLPALVSLVERDGWPPRGADGVAAEARAEQVAAVLATVDPAVVWTDYWDAYRFAHLLEEPPVWLPLTVIERRPALADEVRSSRLGPAAYLVPEADTTGLRLLREERARQDVALLAETSVAGLEVVVTERSVAGLVRMNPWPSPRRQLAAALAAGLLFVGTALGMLLLTRWVRPP